MNQNLHTLKEVTTMLGALGNEYQIERVPPKLIKDLHTLVGNVECCYKEMSLSLT